MKRPVFAALLLMLLLCACTRQETPPENTPPEETGPAWSELAWDGHLPLTYAQQFSVDYAPEGFARITIDGLTYLVVPQGAEPPPDTPAEVTVLRQPLRNIYLQATAAMDCFR